MSITRANVKGLPAILNLDDDLEKLAKPFALTFIGKFTFHRPNMDRIRGFFHSLKLSSSFTIGLIDAHHILIKLEIDLDYFHTFACQSYNILNCQMLILK